MSEVTGAPAPAAEGTTSEAPEGESREQNAEGAEQKEAKAPAPAPSQKKKFKLKVDGEEFEEEIDLADEDRLRKELQMSRAAKKRMSEALEAKKKAFEIIKAFESDPKSMLRRMGEKGRAIAEEYLLADIQDQMLDPKDKEIRELKRRAETAEEKIKRESEERAAKAQEAQEMEIAQRFQKTIIDAVAKSGLPKSPELVKRMAALMQKNLEYGLELTPEDLVAEVKSDITALFQSLVKDADGDHLISMFGADVANKIRKADLKKLQEKQGQVFQKPKGPAPQPAPKNERRPQTMDEWRAEIEKRVREN